MGNEAGNYDNEGRFSFKINIVLYGTIPIKSNVGRISNMREDEKKKMRIERISERPQCIKEIDDQR